MVTFMERKAVKLRESFCLKIVSQKGITCYFLKEKGNRYFSLQVMKKDPTEVPRIAYGWYCWLREDGSWVFSGDDASVQPVVITILKPTDWKEFDGKSFLPINVLEYFSF